MKLMIHLLLPLIVALGAIGVSGCGDPEKERMQREIACLKEFKGDDAGQQKCIKAIAGGN
jgi:hypothetical protein